MDKLFLAILNMSWTSAFVIAAVMLVRLPLRKAPKIISYCLWAVVGFRLICPFSINGLFSLIPFNTQPIPTDIGMQTIPRIDSGIRIIDNAVSASLPPASTVASVNPLQIWIDIGVYAWLVGAAIMVLYGIISYILLKRRMRTAIRTEGNIYETDSIPSPFVLGIIKPKIYLPLSLVVGERDYIILHERTHIRRCDHIVKFAAYFILCLHWFNPLAWAAFLLMGVDMEMSCDERVLKEMGGETKHDYSRSLLSLATQRRIIGGSPLAFGEGGVKERVKNVLNFKKPSRVIIVAAVALVAVLSVGFAVNRAQPVIPAETALEQLINSIDFSKGEVRFQIPVNYPNTEDWNIHIAGRAEFEDGFSMSVHELEAENEQHSWETGKWYTIPIEGRNLTELTMNIYLPDETGILLERRVDLLAGAFHIATLDEAKEVVNSHYPDALNITYLGDETISYTNPPAPVEVHTFEVIVDGERIVCAVSKERGIFFTYSDEAWWAFTGLREGSGATQNMTLDDVRAIAQKIGADLTMGDLRDFVGTDVGSGIFVMQYEIAQSDYVLLVGSVNMTDVSYAYLLPHSGAENEETIDIRFYDVDKYLANGTRMPVRPLPGAAQEEIYELIQRVENNLCIIMSSPLTSSNPQDYINEHNEEYENLAFKYSEGVLEYLLSEFEAGNSDGLRGHIMMRICKDILGPSNNVTDESLSPQEWYSQLSVISQTWLPDFEPENPEGEYGELAYSAITQYYSQLDYGFLVSAPTVYGAYEEDGKLKIIMTVFYERYRLFGKTLESTGGGIIPGAAIFKKDERDAWVFEEYLEVGTANLPEGAYFHDSIQKLCVMPVSGREIDGLAKKMSGDYVNDARRELLSQNLITHLLTHGQTGVSLLAPGGELVELT